MTTATVRVPTQRAPELLGQTVVVIGGSAGIGLETARHARTEGADVILTARNPERLKEVAHELGALNSAGFDASDPDSLARFFDSLSGPIDHVMVGGPVPGTAVRSRWIQRSPVAPSPSAWCLPSRSPKTWWGR